MARIRCGNYGTPHEGTVQVVRRDYLDDELARYLEIECSTTSADNGFPIVLRLDTNELLELVAAITNGLLPGAEVGPKLHPLPAEKID